MHSEVIKIPCVSNDGNGVSVFSSREIVLGGTAARMLSDQQAALNFRLRTSDASYESDWHTAGDPTLLIVLSGTVELELRDGTRESFSAGEMFVAQDYLNEDVIFSEEHGHKAKVVGGLALTALHLKLEKR